MKAYFDLNGIKYEKMHIVQKDGKYLCVNGEQDLSTMLPQIRELIQIYEGNLNDIGKVNTLSYTWYSKTANRGKVKQLERNALNYLQNIRRARVREALI